MKVDHAIQQLGYKQFDNFATMSILGMTYDEETLEVIQEFLPDFSFMKAVEYFGNYL